MLSRPKMFPDRLWTAGILRRNPKELLAGIRAKVVESHWFLEVNGQSVLAVPFIYPHRLDYWFTDWWLR